MRFFGYLSPNGMAYRVHLAHRDAMSENGYELEGEAIWYSSVGSDCCGLSAASPADEFLEEFAEYPGLYSYKYPKAGTDNSVVTAWSYDIKYLYSRFKFCQQKG